MPLPPHYEPATPPAVSPAGSGRRLTPGTSSKFLGSISDMDVDLGSQTPTLSPSFPSISPGPDTSLTISTQTRSQPPSLSPSPPPVEARRSRNHVSLSTRLSFLSSLAISEQSLLPTESVDRLHQCLDVIQRSIASSPHEPPPPPTLHTEQPSDGSRHVLEESRELLSHLTESLQTLQKRRAETLHLHGHLRSMISTLAVANEEQKEEVNSLNSQMRHLRFSNKKLLVTSEELQNQIIELEAREEILETRNNELETMHSSSISRFQDLETENLDLRRCLEVSEQRNLEDEIALEAMSAAVGGLEGWMDSFIARSQSHLHKDGSHSASIRSNHSFQGTLPYNPEPTPPTAVTIRGRGRFRGRYDASSHPTGPLSPPSTPSTAVGNAGNGPMSDWTILNKPEQLRVDRTVTAITGTPSRFRRSRKIVEQQEQQRQQQHRDELERVLDVQEGVKSWIKGFRDVEESIRTRVRRRDGERGRNDPHLKGMTVSSHVEEQSRSVNNNDDDDDDEDGDVFADGDGDGDSDGVHYHHRNRGGYEEEFGDFESAITTTDTGSA